MRWTERKCKKRTYGAARNTKAAAPPHVILILQTFYGLGQLGL